MKPSLVATGALLLVSALAVYGARRPPKGGAEGRVLSTRATAPRATGSTPTDTARSRPCSRALRRTCGISVTATDGRSPRNDFTRWIDGREDGAAHGTREMPVWGERFRAPERGLDPRIRAIVAYLDSVQGR